MSTNVPHTLSVKRKRNEAPVDSLVVQRNDKRLKSHLHEASSNISLKRKFDLDASTRPGIAEHGALVSGESDGNGLEGHKGTLIWKRLKSTHTTEQEHLTPKPSNTSPRRFHIHSDEVRNDQVLIEHGSEAGTTLEKNESASNTDITQGAGFQPQGKASPPRKRPGAGIANKPNAPKVTPSKPNAARLGPSEEAIKHFEAFSKQVENEEASKTQQAPRRSSLKFKPIVPKLRYKDRHPEKSQKPETMDVDNDEYVYDTYVREIVMPDADGKIPEPEGTVGVIVLAQEDEEWWFGQDVSDKEFGTDDDDENAEDYYANDYPEDEMSSEDEFGRHAYNYFHGESDEEFNLSDEVGDDDDDDEHIRAISATPIKKSAGYWGVQGEQ